MKGGSILKHVLSTGYADLYQVESIELGAVGEGGIIKMRYLTVKSEERLVVPSNIIYSMVDSGALEVYNRQR